MSTHLRVADQRWYVMCERVGCLNHIVADEGTHEVQQKQLLVLVVMLSWNRSMDVGDLCPTCAVDLPAPIPRDELCQRDAWCVLRAGHVDGCQRIGKRATSENLTGPQMAAKRRY